MCYDVSGEGTGVAPVTHSLIGGARHKRCETGSTKEARAGERRNDGHMTVRNYQAK